MISTSRDSGPIVDYLSQREQDLLAQASLWLEKQLVSPMASTKEHPIEMCQILTSWHVRGEILRAALLYPLLDKGIDLRPGFLQVFGEDAVRTAQKAIALLRGSLPNTHLSRGEEKSYLRISALRRLFMTAWEDFEVALLCLSFQEAKSGCLELMTRAERERWAEDTRIVFAPLAEMLGMWRWRRRLGDISLEILEPSLYKRLGCHVAAYHERHQARCAEISARLIQELATHGIEGQAKLHVSPISSLYHRMNVAKQRGREFNLDEVIDILRVDVLVPSDLECYGAVGLIHRLWRPASHQTLEEGRIRDRIANPQFNGYRSLITMITEEKGARGHLMEFRIRTPDMENINLEGIVAAKLKPPLPAPIRNAWWEDKTIRACVCTHSNTVTDPWICVFSPLGEAYKLPRDSTPIDYAFRVHSTLGPHARFFRVNGHSVSYNHKLQRGDLIQIEFDPDYAGPAQEWIRVVQTTSARNKVKRMLSQRKLSIPKGRRVIDKVLRRELKAYGLWFSPDEVEKALTKAAGHFGYYTLNDLYFNVLQQKISPDEIVSRAIEDQLVDHIISQNGESWSRNTIRIAQCWVNRKKAQRCSPDSRVSPGTPIVGRLATRSGDRVLIVHRRDCPQAPSPEEAIPLQWRGTSPPREAAKISISAWDQPRLLSRIMHAVYNLYDQDLYLHGVNAEALPDRSASISLEVDAPSLEQISLLDECLKKLQEQGYIQGFKTWQLPPTQKVLMAGRSKALAQNPYALTEVRNRAMFFGRTDEIAQIVECIHNPQNLIVLYGYKRVGKTSILYYMANHYFSGQRDVIPVYLDALGIASFDAGSFLLGLAQEINKALMDSFGSGVQNPRKYFISQGGRDGPFLAFHKWLDIVNEKLRGRRLLLMIDEFSRTDELYKEKKLDRSFFENLRWLIANQRDVTFLLCVQETAYRSLGTDREVLYSLLRDAHPVRLGHLDNDSAVRLIRQPMGQILKYDDQVVDRILSLTGRSPYLLHIICHSLVSRVIRRKRSRVTPADLNAVLPEILVNGRHYFSHFLSAVRGTPQAVLSAIALALDDNNLGVISEDIFDALQQCGYPIHRQEFDRILIELSEWGLVETREAGEERRYCIPVELFQLWLQRNAPPSLLTTGRRT